MNGVNISDAHQNFTSAIGADLIINNQTKSNTRCGGGRQGGQGCAGSNYSGRA